MANYVTVSAVCNYPATAARERLLEQATAYVERASRLGADILAFPEVWWQTLSPWEADGKSRLPDMAEPLDGTTVTAMGTVAKRFSMNIIWPFLTKEEGRIYNSAVLLDRRGEVAGVYHKMHPTVGELEKGVTPGDRAGVFDTDFGRIGICICFDLNYDDVLAGLRQGNPEVLFFPSQYRGGLQLQMWAWQLRAFAVSAFFGELGMIVDRGGRVVRESSRSEEVMAERINLDSALLHLDFNLEKLEAMLDKYREGLSYRYYDREAVWMIACEREDMSIGDVMKESELEGLSEYLRRSNELVKKALTKANEKREQ